MDPEPAAMMDPESALVWRAGGRGRVHALDPAAAPVRLTRGDVTLVLAHRGGWTVDALPVGCELNGRTVDAMTRLRDGDRLTLDGLTLVYSQPGRTRRARRRDAPEAEVLAALMMPLRVSGDKLPATATEIADRLGLAQSSVVRLLLAACRRRGLPAHDVSSARRQLARLLVP